MTTERRIDWNREIALEELWRIKYKPVPEDATDHSVEKRDLVEVPLDYLRLNGPRIKVFYRLIPAYGSTTDDVSKPVIAVFNGGPGYPCKEYRPLDFNYSDPTDKKNGKFDRFKYLLKDFRILLIDQRGTDGYSAPLDMDDPTLQPEIIVRYFGTEYQAYDHLKVIDAVISTREDFFIIAQSYGGLIGMKYLTLQGARRPKGIVFSSATMPYREVVTHMTYRRKAQHELNLQFARVFPNAPKRLSVLREHLREIGSNPIRVHFLCEELGHGDAGAWEQALSSKVDEALNATSSADAEKILADNNPFLNDILSSSALTPGYTDRTLAELVRRAVPYEDWMLDETWTYQIKLDGSWKQDLLQAMDRVPPPPVSFPPLSELRGYLAQNHVLFTLAQGDSMQPTERQKTAIRTFLVEGRSKLVDDLPGGHNAIFTDAGYRAFRDWIRSIDFGAQPPAK